MQRFRVYVCMNPKVSFAYYETPCIFVKYSLSYTCVNLFANDIIVAWNIELKVGSITVG